MAFVRDVTSELGIPGMATIPPEAWGIPSIGINGFSGFGDSTEGPYTNRNKVFEIIDNVSWIKGRHSFKVGAALPVSTITTRSATSSRAAGSSSTAGRPGRLTGAVATTAPAFADFLLGYQRLSELSVQLAVTEFRAVSQSYYFADTWRMRDNMTLDLGLRYEYVPPFEDKAGTLINAYLPFFDQGAARRGPLASSDAGAHRRGGVLRGFQHPLQPGHPDGPRRPHGRPAHRRRQAEFRAARRVGVDAERSVVDSRRRRHVLHAGHRQSALRHGPQRGRASSGHLRPAVAGSELERSLRGIGHESLRRAPPLVCISNHYMLGNEFDRTTPRMLQYLFNVQRELGRNTALEVGYLGSRSSHLERMFDRNEVIPGAGGTQTRRPYPEFTRLQTIGNVAEAEVQLAGRQADAAPRQRLLCARRLHALEVERQRQRHPHAQR